MPDLELIILRGGTAPVEIVKAFIVTGPGGRPDDGLAKEVQELVKTRLAAHEYPREIEFTAGPPLTPAGKIMGRKLKEGDGTG